MNDKPLIAITTGGENHFPCLPELYRHAVEGAGAVAVFLGPDTSIIDAMMRYDGFIIPGGRDIDPLFYNEGRVADMRLEDESRVNFDLALFQALLKTKKPLLGICYGMQIINVALGGTLYQDICTQKGENINHREGAHLIRVDDNPFTRSGQYEVNSSHHQAVKRIGDGLDVFALAPDGIIEAFYSATHPFLLGVQWHPERMLNGISQKIFTSFIGKCRDFN